MLFRRPAAGVLGSRRADARLAWLDAQIDVGVEAARARLSARLRLDLRGHLAERRLRRTRALLLPPRSFLAVAVGEEHRMVVALGARHAALGILPLIIRRIPRHGRRVAPAGGHRVVIVGQGGRRAGRGDVDVLRRDVVAHRHGVQAAHRRDGRWSGKSLLRPGEARRRGRQGEQARPLEERAVERRARVRWRFRREQVGDVGLLEA